MRNLLFIALGFIFLTLGMVGVVLPLLPTTPLVLLSAICFSYGSKRLEGWLCRSRIFGPFIDNYRTKRGISKLRKVVTIIYLWFGLITSMVIIRTVMIYVILGVVGVGVTIHLLMIKTRNNEL